VEVSEEALAVMLGETASSADLGHSEFLSPEQQVRLPTRWSSPLPKESSLVPTNPSSFTCSTLQPCKSPWEVLCSNSKTVPILS